jgi:hypothetical protein
MAVDMVLVAFRAGFYVAGMAEKLESTSETSESWTHVYPEVSEARAKELLADFHKSHVRR